MHKVNSCNDCVRGIVPRPIGILAIDALGDLTDWRHSIVVTDRDQLPINRSGRHQLPIMTWDARLQEWKGLTLQYMT